MDRFGLWDLFFGIREIWGRELNSRVVRALSKGLTGAFRPYLVQCEEFNADFYKFRCTIKELERRLGAVISQAFDDCTTIGNCFKLMDSFE
eukprot:1194909-Prorocentrum_minimum.AAC.12